MSRRLASLPAAPPGHVPHVRSSYRILGRAHASVSGLLNAVGVLDDGRRSGNASTKGRMSKVEVDVVRSAIVFTSAGLDASMTRLVRDVGRALIGKAGTGARQQYEQYLKQELAGQKLGATWRDAIIAMDPGPKLLNMYLAERTRASFQGSGDLKTRVRNALGISASLVPDADLESLDAFFVARNAISHDMDLVDVDSGSIARHHRTANTVVTECDQVFAVAVSLIRGPADACRRAGI